MRRMVGIENEEILAFMRKGDEQRAAVFTGEILKLYEDKYRLGSENLKC